MRRSLRCPTPAAALLSCLVALGAAAEARAATTTIEAGGAWCAVAQAAAPGDTILLGPGTHTSACVLEQSGLEGSPITLASADPTVPARLSPTDGSATILELGGGHWRVEGLVLGPHAAGQAGVRLRGDAGGQSAGVELIDNLLEDLGGDGIVAGDAGVSYADLVISGNRLRRLGGVGVNLGCAAGSVDCQVRDALIEANFIEDTGLSGAGVGLRVYRDSSGRLLRNVLRRSPGANVELYGGLEALPADGLGAVLVRFEANRVGPPTSGAALRVFGGPVLVQNNVVIGGSEGGILAGPAADPADIDRIYLLGNSLVGIGGDALRLLGWELGGDLALQNNAVLQEDRLGEGLPSPGGAVAVGGNLSCASAAACFADRAELDFSPQAALQGAAVISVYNLLSVDLCGAPRALPGDAIGALGAGTTLTGGFPAGEAPADLNCPPLDSGGDDGAVDSGADGGEDGSEAGADGGGDKPVVQQIPAYAQANEKGGCSCGAAGRPPARPLALGLSLLGLSALIARRRPRS